MSEALTIGIDSNSYGFYAASSSPIAMFGSDSVSDVGWITSSSKEWLDRLKEVHHSALEWFAFMPRGSSVWCEEALVLPKNPETTRKLVMMTGVLYAAFMEAKPDATWFFVNVSTWRRQVLNPAKGQAPRNGDGWKALAREHVLKSWPESALAPALERYDLVSAAAAERAERVKLWDLHPDLYDAACLMEYGQQQLTVGTTA